MIKILRRRSISIVLACIALAGVAIIGVSAAIGGGTPRPPQGDELLANVNSKIAADPNMSQDIGQLTLVRKGVFATSSGDPVDVDVLSGKGGLRCLTVSGDAYSSSVSCFQLKDAAESGSYQVAIPLGDAPVLVVGYAPNGRERIFVRAGNARAAGMKHENVFIAALPAGSLGPDNAARVDVAFEP